MNTFMRLAKEGKIGRLCKRGAWIIAGLGTLQIVIQFYAIWGMYHQMQQNSPGSGMDLYNFLLYAASFIFPGTMAAIFYFLILYTAGTIINSLFVPDKNDDDVRIEPLEEDEVVIIEK